MASDNSKTVIDTPIAKWLHAMKKAGKIKSGGKLVFVDRKK
jgi:hypothetical protein